MSPDQLSSADARLAIQRYHFVFTYESQLKACSMISDAVGLVLAQREGENTLTALRRIDPLGYPSNVEYILKNAEVNKTRDALSAAVARLSALPHAPIEIDFDLAPLGAWMDAHRAQFDAFKKFCDEYRPPSPKEEGELHPCVDALLSELRDLEARAEHLTRSLERRKESKEAVEFRRRARILDAMDLEFKAEFSRVMNKVDFSELSEEGQRVAIQQRVLKVARDTLNWMLKVKESGGVEDIFWFEPLRR
ncbi:hypothetical protein K438DRAFT_1957988 [Mycena galopus ATCC 62051]|nr:hypothetical protein K438DRAFT_1957988 [Mycena galopus ATCC 62051]